MLQIKTYDDYLLALKDSPTEMFWYVPDDVQVLDSFKFDIYFSYDNEYDRKMNHVFLNGDSYDGVMLFSKHKPITKKEFVHRFLIERKEWDMQASIPKQYDRFILSTYQDYEDAILNSSSEMFWGIWPNIDITNDKIFDMYFSHHNSYDRLENHVFKHIFRNEETYTNGIVLFSKHKKITEKEFTHRFLIEKKEHNVVASKVTPYDIVFISYNEPLADDNFNNLLKTYPNAKRVHGVKGIHQAHIKAAELAKTEMFWVVDGDAEIVDGFNFDHEVSTYERDIVHVWRSKNPINDLVYGYGGVKLLPTHLTLSMDVSKPDMTTSISSKFKALEQISNITAFNTDEFSTWRSAFRECAKLSSRVIDRQNEEETEERLNIWCSQGLDNRFGDQAISGALAGREFGKQHKGDVESLKLINDFDWLYNYWKQLNG